MSPRDWWRRRRRAARRRKAAAASEKEPLREFVYLDEVSVYSLLASRIGALATEFTDTESSSLSAELKTQGGLSSPVARAQMSSGIKASQSSGTQVMRKSTVQSTFGDLYSFIRDSLVIGGPGRGAAPRIARTADLASHATTSEGWVINPASLARGDVLEVAVALDADDTFRASMVMQTVYGFIRDLPSSVGREGFADAVYAMRTLDGLLAGVVPVRGRALDYQVVEMDDHELIVHRELVEQLGQDLPTRPLHVVGICEAELFWKDLRRVLFSSSQYRMLCRLGVDGVARKWTPVKLLDVLEGTVPGLRDIVARVPEMMAQAGQHSDGTDDHEMMRRALTSYAIDLCAVHRVALTEAELRSHGLPTAGQTGSYDGFMARRRAFDELTECIAETYGFDVDPVEAARLRVVSQVEYRLMSMDNPAEDSGAPAGPAADHRYLDCEIIAVYW